MNIMSNLGKKAYIGAVALGTMAVVGAGIKNAMKLTPAEETKQAELVENLLFEIKYGSNATTAKKDSLREACFKECIQNAEDILYQIEKLDSIDTKRLSDALKAYNIPIDSLKHLK